MNKKKRKYGITNKEYFGNLEKIWIKLERQPKYKDIQKPLSSLSAGAYERRFGTWSNALEEFVKYTNNEEIETQKEQKEISDSKTEEISKVKIEHKTKRNINHRMRFIVMKRDDFKCT